MRFQTAEESYDDYRQMLRPGMTVKSFEDYWQIRLRSMALVAQMRRQNRRRTRRTKVSR
jgi:hypothetical protein